MFILKKNYYLIIESIKDVSLKTIKKRYKYIVIYRNQGKSENKKLILNFRKLCKTLSIDFFVANNLSLANELNSDGIYLSAYNHSFKPLTQKKKKFRIIGSAHTNKEIYMKIKQGCKIILFSKLFPVKYDYKAPHLGVVKFNTFVNKNKNLIPLGGIHSQNLNSLKMIKCKGFALKSEIKKKPAKIFNRLF